MQELTYDAIAIGDRASFLATVSEEMVRDFAKLSGDNNPLHVDENYARQTPFGRRIAHGMTAGALFSRLVGVHLPGKYSLYLSQSLRFHQPIPLGTELTVSGEVIHKTDSHKIIAVKTEAKDSKAEKLYVSGEAMIQLLR